MPWDEAKGAETTAAQLSASSALRQSMKMISACTGSVFRNSSMWLHTASKHGLSHIPAKLFSQSSDHHHEIPAPRRRLPRATSTPNLHRAAPPTSTSLGFLPWRLSDDGPGPSGSVLFRPSSETFHKCRHKPRHLPGV